MEYKKKLKKHLVDPERKIKTSLRLPGRAREDEQRSAANEGGASLTQLAPAVGGA